MQVGFRRPCDKLVIFLFNLSYFHFTFRFFPGEQWDYPNGWAPLEHLVVDAFSKFNTKESQELAFDVAKKWTLGNYKYYDKKRMMLEKVTAIK